MELLLRFHNNNKHFYIVDHYKFASNNEKGTIITFPWQQ
jgi:hypothetical protein